MQSFAAFVTEGTRRFNVLRNDAWGVELSILVATGYRLLVSFHPGSTGGPDPIPDLDHEDQAVRSMARNSHLGRNSYTVQIRTRQTKPDNSGTAISGEQDPSEKVLASALDWFLKERKPGVVKYQPGGTIFNPAPGHIVKAVVPAFKRVIAEIKGKFPDYSFGVTDSAFVIVHKDWQSLHKEHGKSGEIRPL